MRVLNQLFSADGQSLLSRLDGLDLSERNIIKVITDLRKDYPVDLIRAAVDISILRQRAATKFSRASQMYFTREALEQSSGEAISSYRAERFHDYGTVADLACGIGADAIHLARHSRVIAVDNDPTRLVMARANAEACGVADRIDFVEADITEFDLPPVDAIFFDPARRARGRRIGSVNDYSPPLSIIERWLPKIPAIGVKISPAVRFDEIVWDCEMEFISVDRELKEAVLWFGPLKTAKRRATLLPSRATLVGAERTAPISVTPPRRFLYEPDPAVIRSHLVEDLAEMIGATKLDPDIAFLTSGEEVETPFARSYQINESMPFNVKHLNKRLRKLDAGHVIIKKRGSPIEPEELQKKLKLTGSQTIVVVLTHLNGQPSMLLCGESVQ